MFNRAGGFQSTRLAIGDPGDDLLKSAVELFHDLWHNVVGPYLGLFQPVNKGGEAALKRLNGVGTLRFRMVDPTVHLLDRSLQLGHLGALTVGIELVGNDLNGFFDGLAAALLRAGSGRVECLFGFSHSLREILQCVAERVCFCPFLIELFCFLRIVDPVCKLGEKVPHFREFLFTLTVNRLEMVDHGVHGLLKCLKSEPVAGVFGEREPCFFSRFQAISELLNLAFHTRVGCGANAAGGDELL